MKPTPAFQDKLASRENEGPAGASPPAPQPSIREEDDAQSSMAGDARHESRRAPSPQNRAGAAGATARDSIVVLGLQIDSDDAEEEREERHCEVCQCAYEKDDAVSPPAPYTCAIHPTLRLTPLHPTPQPCFLPTPAL